MSEINIGDVLEDEAGRAVVIGYEVSGWTTSFPVVSLLDSLRAYFWREMERWTKTWGATYEEMPSGALGPFTRNIVVARVADAHIPSLIEATKVTAHDFTHVFRRRLRHQPRMVFCNLHTDSDFRVACIHYFPFAAKVAKEDVAASVDQFADPVCIMRNSVDGQMFDLIRFRTMNDVVLARLLEIC